MSGLDLSAARVAARKMCRDNMPVDFMGDKRMEQWTDLMAHYAVAAAAPLIEAQVREQVAAEIIDIELDAIERGYKTYAKAMHRAARIVLGQS